MLVAQRNNGSIVEAGDAVRSDVHSCRDCGETVILHRGKQRKKVPHFAHRAGSRCAFHRPMSPEHRRAQFDLAAALRKSGYVAELEVRVLSGEEERRSDVLVWRSESPNRRVAIEIQSSDISIEDLERRTLSYVALGVFPVWVRLYDFRRFEDAVRIKQNGCIHVPRHRARAWERWLADTSDHVWFMEKTTGSLWRAHLQPAHSYVEPSGYYCEGGDYESFGGYWRELKRDVVVNLEGPISLGQLALSLKDVIIDGAKVRTASFTHPSLTKVVPLTRYRFPDFGRELVANAGGKWTLAHQAALDDDWYT